MCPVFILGSGKKKIKDLDPALSVSSLRYGKYLYRQRHKCSQATLTNNKHTPTKKTQRDFLQLKFMKVRTRVTLSKDTRV